VHALALYPLKTTTPFPVQHTNDAHACTHAHVVAAGACACVCVPALLCFSFPSLPFTVPFFAAWVPFLCCVCHTCCVQSRTHAHAHSRAHKPEQLGTLAPLSHTSHTPAVTICCAHVGGGVLRRLRAARIYECRARGRAARRPAGAGAMERGARPHCEFPSLTSAKCRGAWGFLIFILFACCTGGVGSVDKLEKRGALENAHLPSPCHCPLPLLSSPSFFLLTHIRFLHRAYASLRHVKTNSHPRDPPNSTEVTQSSGSDRGQENWGRQQARFGETRRSNARDRPCCPLKSRRLCRRCRALSPGPAPASPSRLVDASLVQVGLDPLADEVGFGRGWTDLQQPTKHRLHQAPAQASPQTTTQPTLRQNKHPPGPYPLISGSRHPNCCCTASVFIDMSGSSR
jgi:hypothetical protein